MAGVEAEVVAVLMMVVEEVLAIAEALGIGLVLMVGPMPTMIDTRTHIVGRNVGDCFLYGCFCWLFCWRYIWQRVMYKCMLNVFV